MSVDVTRFDEVVEDVLVVVEASVGLIAQLADRPGYLFGWLFVLNVLVGVFALVVVVLEVSTTLVHGATFRTEGIPDSDAGYIFQACLSLVFLDVTQLRLVVHDVIGVTKNRRANITPHRIINADKKLLLTIPSFWIEHVLLTLLILKNGVLHNFVHLYIRSSPREDIWTGLLGNNRSVINGLKHVGLSNRWQLVDNAFLLFSFSCARLASHCSGRKHVHVNVCILVFTLFVHL